MKKTLLLFISFLLTNIVMYGQNKWIICLDDFDTPYYYCSSGVYSLALDPSPGNTWQICIPNKPVFDQAHSPVHAILTDSTGPYPVNDTSVFIFKTFVIDYPMGMDVPVIGGWYKFDSDSLKDFGRIDVSYDHGSTWNDILSDTLVLWNTQKPVFTGRIYQWREFSASWIFYPITFDTLYFRYTFISDSIETNQQGWMLDDLYVVDHIEGISNPELSQLLSVYPNPARDKVTVSVSNFHGPINVSVFDLPGGLRMKQTLVSNASTLDISSLPDGLYILKAESAGQQYVVKLLKDSQ